MSEPQNETSAPKRVLYPYLGIQKTLEFAEAIKLLGGHREEVPKSLIAKQMKLPEDSAMLTAMVGSSKAFGMVEGWRTLKLTDVAKKYFYPTTPNEKQQALLKIVVSPTVFEKLVKRFDGDTLPPNGLLSNLLHTEMEVPESWTQRVVSNFITSMTLAGALDDGILRYDAATHGSRAGSSNQAPEEQVDTNSAPQAPVVAVGNLKLTPISGPPINHVQGSVNVWVFGSKESAVRIETTKELSAAVWEKLNKYVQLLKPDEVEEL